MSYHDSLLALRTQSSVNDGDKKQYYCEVPVLRTYIGTMFHHGDLALVYKTCHFPLNLRHRH
jgi:hypothetical protein